MSTIDTATVRKRIADTLQLPLAKLADDRLLTDIVRESFAMVEMVIDLQEEFGIRLGQEDLKTLETIGALTALIGERAKNAA